MGNILTGEKEFFKEIGQIKYEGTTSDNPMAFRWYDPGKIVAGKTMKDHLRFAVAYWLCVDRSWISAGAGLAGLDYGRAERLCGSHVVCKSLSSGTQ